MAPLAIPLIRVIVSGAGAKQRDRVATNGEMRDADRTESDDG
jgi:hypothetical protein